MPCTPHTPRMAFWKDAIEAQLDRNWPEWRTSHRAGDPQRWVPEAFPMEKRARLIWLLWNHRLIQRGDSRGVNVVIQPGRIQVHLCRLGTTALPPPPFCTDGYTAAELREIAKAEEKWIVRGERGAAENRARADALKSEANTLRAQADELDRRADAHPDAGVRKKWKARANTFRARATEAEAEICGYDEALRRGPEAIARRAHWEALGQALLCPGYLEEPLVSAAPPAASDAPIVRKPRRRSTPER